MKKNEYAVYEAKRQFMNILSHNLFRLKKSEKFIEGTKFANGNYPIFL